MKHGRDGETTSPSSRRGRPPRPLRPHRPRPGAIGKLGCSFDLEGKIGNMCINLVKKYQHKSVYNIHISAFNSCF